MKKFKGKGLTVRRLKRFKGDQVPAVKRLKRFKVKGLTVKRLKRFEVKGLKSKEINEI